jgi:drug/metabolite transporter (DMT)-like permease
MTSGGHPQAKGAAIVCAGVLLLSPDSLFIQLMNIDQWTVLFFRGACSLLGYLALMRFALGVPLRPTGPKRGGLALGIGVSLAATAGNICFVVSIRHINAGLALVILAGAPMFTILISRLFTSERVPRRTWLAASAVIAGIAAIFVTRPDGGEMIGAVAALGASIAASVVLVLVRAVGDVDEILPWQAVGALFLTLLMLPLADPASADARDLALAVSFGLVMLPLALVLIMEGPRRITAPETSLLLLLEAILGPAWIWFVLDDPPTLQAVLAGVVILGALATNAVLAQRELSSAARSA